jgi:hypothetical protein
MLEANTYATQTIGVYLSPNEMEQTIAQIHRLREHIGHMLTYHVYPSNDPLKTDFRQFVTLERLLDAYGTDVKLSRQKPLTAHYQIIDVLHLDAMVLQLYMYH